MNGMRDPVNLTCPHVPVRLLLWTCTAPQASGTAALQAPGAAGQTNLCVLDDTGLPAYHGLHQVAHPLDTVVSSVITKGSRPFSFDYLNNYV